MGVRDGEQPKGTSPGPVRKRQPAATAVVEPEAASSTISQVTAGISSLISARAVAEPHFSVIANGLGSITHVRIPKDSYIFSSVGTVRWLRLTSGRSRSMLFPAHSMPAWLACLHQSTTYTHADWCFLCTAMLRLHPMSQVTGMSDTISSTQSMLGGVAASLQRKLAGVSAATLSARVCVSRSFFLLAARALPLSTCPSTPSSPSSRLMPMTSLPVAVFSLTG